MFLYKDNFPPYCGDIWTVVWIEVTGSRGYGWKILFATLADWNKDFLGDHESLQWRKGDLGSA